MVSINAKTGTMISKEIQKKIKLLQLHTKRIMNSFFVGDYRSKQKGYGMDFDQIRDYHVGDDVRFIDWKSSARMNKMLVKQYIHEHSKTIMLMVDVSASSLFGSTEQIKRETIAQVATILSLAAQHDKARIGLILFSEEIEYYLPPKTGTQHTQVVIDTLWNFKPLKKGTDINKACAFLSKIIRSDALVCILSDFIGTYDQVALTCVAKKFDTVIIRCCDRYEKKLPTIGFLNLIDSETGQKIIVDVRSKSSNGYEKLFQDRITQQNNDFKKNGIDYIDIDNNDQYVDSLILFFVRRLH